MEGVEVSEMVVEWMEGVVEWWMDEWSGVSEWK